tara:strand:- start:3891 stop:4295 length:405 start_codon:yes stop_codon:yes gene_type:complete
MKNIEYISRKKKLVAIVLKNNFNKNGVNFVTPDRLSLQVGYMKHSQNHIIKPHFHIKQKRVVHNTNEILYVKKGKIRIDFFHRNKKFSHRILKTGDLIAIVSEGHGFKILEKTELIEIKQGPFSKKKDKILIRS